LKEAKRHSEATVDGIAKALSRFEADTKFRDFKTFHFEQAIAFKRCLAEQDSSVTGEKRAKRRCTPRSHTSNGSSNGWLVSRATSPVSVILTRTTSTCLTKIRALRLHGAKRGSRLWSSQAPRCDDAE